MVGNPQAIDRKPRVGRLVAIAAGIGALGLVVLSWDPGRQSLEEISLPADSDLWVSGVLHVHSRHSDGAGTVDDVARAAARAGLDFVVLTDHAGLDALVENEEGYHRGVLTLVGVEASTPAGHALGLDLPATPMRLSGSGAREVLGQIDQLGGFALAAHPDADRESMAWTGWDLGGYQGLEVFNAYSTYRRRGVLSSLAYFFVSPFWQTDRFNWALDWNRKLVEDWDRRSAERRLVAWAGSDAHGGFRLFGDHFARWPGYAQVFGMVRNHVLLGEPLTGNLAVDGELVWRALAEGRGYVALGDLPSAAGFRFYAETAQGRWPMGSDIAISGGTGWVRLRAAVPEGDVRLGLFRDGRLIEESSGDLSLNVQDPGIYRVEVRRRISTVGEDRYVSWILSNPIAILPEERLTARLDANAVPHGASPSFGEPRLYHINFYADANPGCSSMDVSTGGLGPGSLRADFRLGVPPSAVADTPEAPWGRCAVADRDFHDFAGDAGIRFEVRSNAIHRVSFVLADNERENRIAHIWTQSFLTDEDWQEVTVGFSRLMGDDWRDPDLDLSDVSEVAFFFDTSNTRPGTSGWMEVRNFSLLPPE